MGSADASAEAGQLAQGNRDTAGAEESLGRWPSGRRSRCVCETRAGGDEEARREHENGSGRGHTHGCCCVTVLGGRHSKIEVRKSPGQQQLQRRGGRARREQEARLDFLGKTVPSGCGGRCGRALCENCCRHAVVEVDFAKKPRKLALLSQGPVMWDSAWSRCESHQGVAAADKTCS